MGAIPYSVRIESIEINNFKLLKKVMYSPAFGYTTGFIFQVLEKDFPVDFVTYSKKSDLVAYKNGCRVLVFSRKVLKAARVDKERLNIIVNGVCK